MRAIRNIVVVLLSAFAVVGAVDQARHLDKSMTKGPKLAKKTKGPSMSKLTTKAPTIKGSKKATLPPGPTTLSQIFFIEAITKDGTTPPTADINLLANDLVATYNLLVAKYTNPQALKMIKVITAELIASGITRRQLQNTKAIAKVDVEGTCNGCGTNGRFTKNDSRRLQTLLADLPTENDLQLALDVTVKASTAYTSIIAINNLEEEEPIVAPSSPTIMPATVPPKGSPAPTPKTVTLPPAIVTVMPTPKTTVTTASPGPTPKTTTLAPATVTVMPTPKTSASPVLVTSPPTAKTSTVTSPPTAKTTATPAPVVTTPPPTVKGDGATPAPTPQESKAPTTPTSPPTAGATTKRG